MSWLLSPPKGLWMMVQLFSSSRLSSCFARGLRLFPQYRSVDRKAIFQPAVNTTSVLARMICRVGEWDGADSLSSTRRPNEKLCLSYILCFCLCNTIHRDLSTNFFFSPFGKLKIYFFSKKYSKLITSAPSGAGAGRRLFSCPVEVERSQKLSRGEIKRSFSEKISVAPREMYNKKNILLWFSV